MKPDATLKRSRESIVKYFLKDVCRITTVGTVPVVVDGVATVPDVSRLYKGSEDIPCRFDISRAQRAESLDHQEVVASEWVLHLPWGFNIRPNDKITLTDANGYVRRFEMKKASDFEDWGVTAEYIVTEMEFQHG